MSETKITEVRRLRKDADMTQKEAAEATNLPLRTFRSYDRGETEPPADRMDHIRRVLGSKEPVDENALKTGDDPLRRYSVAGGSDETASEIVVDPRIIGSEGSLPDPGDATAHCVSSRMMGPWMRDRQHVVARDCSQIETAGRYVLRWGKGGEKVVVEAFRLGDKSVQIREHAPQKTYKLNEAGREGDAVIYEREDGAQITIEVLGRVVIPGARERQMLEEMTESLSEMLSAALG